MSKKKESPALHLMLFTYHECCRAAPFSFDRKNSALRAALSLAVCGGLRFDLGDFETIEERCKGHHWMTRDGHMLGEGFYAGAVAEDNMSACLSFEAWKDRAPVIADDCQAAGYYRWAHASPRARQRARLAVGSRLVWNGERVIVTSFAEDGSHVVACSYKPCPDNRTILHRYKITRADIIAERKRRKAETKGKEARNADTT